MTRLKIATVAILAMAALASAGVVAAGARRPDAPKSPPPAPVAAPIADEPKPDARPATPTATLTVEARDLSTDAPVPGVRLEFSLGRGSKKVEATTDGSGIAQFSHPADGRYFFVSATREGYVSQAIRWDYDANAPAAPDRLLFQMEKATTVGGRVLDQDRKPMAGATVVIDVSKGYPQSRQWVDFKYETTRDRRRRPLVVLRRPREAGLRQAGGLPPPLPPGSDVHRDGGFQAAVRASATDRRPSTSGAGRSSMGRVVSPDGHPVADAEVFYGSGRRYANAIPPLKTDAQGRFTIGVEPGTLSTLTAQATGFGPALLPIRGRSGTVSGSSSRSRSPVCSGVASSIPRGSPSPAPRSRSHGPAPSHRRPLPGQ